MAKKTKKQNKGWKVEETLEPTIEKVTIDDLDKFIVLD